MNKSTHFICLGAHKCRTSWLFNCLYEHPEIYIKDKVNYFYHKQRYALKRKTSDLLRKSLVGEKIWWQLKHSSFTRKYHKLNTSKQAIPKLASTNTRQELYSYFREDIEYVKSLLNRNDLNWY